jgi:hypothetical protein
MPARRALSSSTSRFAAAHRRIDRTGRWGGGPPVLGQGPYNPARSVVSAVSLLPALAAPWRGRCVEQRPHSWTIRRVCENIFAVAGSMALRVARRGCSALHRTEATDRLKASPRAGATPSNRLPASRQRRKIGTSANAADDISWLRSTVIRIAQEEEIWAFAACLQS